MKGRKPAVGRGLMISAPKKSSGKTTVTLGIAAAMLENGVRVRVFKKGPDYIDPMWHKAVTGLPCYNIDPYWMDEPTCRSIFQQHGSTVDLSLVEGNHGLHDGMDLKGANSSAGLAKTLGIPVLLIVDAGGMNRGVAAIVLGQQQMDPQLTIAGVILNHTSNSRQVGKQIRAIEHYCGLKVLGALPKNIDLQIKERHLGLMTVHEVDRVRRIIAATAATVREHCDLETLQRQAAVIAAAAKNDTVTVCSDPVKIGVAADQAFCFYYEHNLEALCAAGAELVFFDTMKSTRLPVVDALYIGGGFPESFLPELTKNRTLRDDIAAVIEDGLPVYAECGGLMYLTRAINRDGNRYEMVGVLPAEVEFVGRPIGKGYVEMETIPGRSWLDVDRPLKGHEFHYSRLVELGADLAFNFKVNRGAGIVDGFDGLLYRNVIASYTHIHSLAVPEWAHGLADFARSRRNAVGVAVPANPGA
jgi:cobyrinic acid a,c-diamide synthase